MSKSLPLRFPDKILYEFLACCMRVTYLTNLELLILLIPMILREEYKLRTSSLCNFLESRYFASLRSNILFWNSCRASSLWGSQLLLWGRMTSQGRVAELVSVFVRAIGWGSKWPTSRVICLSKQRQGQERTGSCSGLVSILPLVFRSPQEHGEILQR
jgi:hypothetical protein